METTTPVSQDASPPRSGPALPGTPRADTAAAAPPPGWPPLAAPPRAVAGEPPSAAMAAAASLLEPAVLDRVTELKGERCRCRLSDYVEARLS